MALGRISDAEFRDETMLEFVINAWFSSASELRVRVSVKDAPLHHVSIARVKSFTRAVGIVAPEYQ
jgi:hypothetical protein